MLKAALLYMLIFQLTIYLCRYGICIPVFEGIFTIHVSGVTVCICRIITLIFLMHLKNIGFVKTQTYDTQLERNHNNTFLHLVLGYACLKSKCKIIELSISVEIKLNCRNPGIHVRHWHWNGVSCVNNINLKLQHLLYIWCHFIGK